MFSRIRKPSALLTGGDEDTSAKIETHDKDPKVSY